MKLYATVTSERASKGQGGEWLDIVITVENPYTKERHTFRTINVRERKCSDSTSYTVDNGGDEYIDSVTFNKGQKGEKQKAGKCYHCSAITKTGLENWHCSNCGRDN